MKDQNFNDWLGEQIATISKAGAYDAVSKSAAYWQKRCEAAEALLDSVQGGEYLNYDVALKLEWEQIKKDQFK